jgi:nucleotide-binding universal stress UspA family protein
MVKDLASEGLSEIHVVHFRLREMSGYAWYSRESRKDADFQADAAVFDLRMAGLAAGAEVRYAFVDRVAEAICDEAAAFGADLIVIGAPRRNEFHARVMGSVSQRVIHRARCAVVVAPSVRSRVPLHAETV